MGVKLETAYEPDARLQCACETERRRDGLERVAWEWAYGAGRETYLKTYGFVNSAPKLQGATGSVVPLSGAPAEDLRMACQLLGMHMEVSRVCARARDTYRTWQDGAEMPVKDVQDEQDHT